MPHHAVSRALSARLAAATLVTATLTSTHVLAQTPIALLRDQDGSVGCVVSRLPIASLVADPPGSADLTRLVVEIRAPRAPAPASLSKLPPGRRDFTRLPIEVYLIPAGADTWPEARKRPPIESQLVDATLTRGVADSDVFARVTYQRDLLGPGVEIVARRTAVAENGEKVVRETRCRIREEDAAKWR